MNLQNLLLTVQNEQGDEFTLFISEFNDFNKEKLKHFQIKYAVQLPQRSINIR